MQPIAKSAMLHQFNQLGEQTVPELAATLRLGGIDTIKVKAHDGIDWMAAFDNHPLAVSSAAQLLNLYEAFKAEGIRLVPWCNPTGRNIPQEIVMAIAAAQACDGVIEMDLEQGAGFWTGPYHLIAGFFRDITEAGVTIDACIDARPNSIIPWVDLTPYVRRWLSQSYWGEGAGRFELPSGRVIREAVDFMTDFGATEYGIVFPAQSPASEIVAAATLAQSLGAVEVSIWHMGSANAETYQGFAEIPGFTVEPIAPAPELGPLPADLVARIVNGLADPFDAAGALVNRGWVEEGLATHEFIKSIKQTLGVA